MRTAIALLLGVLACRDSSRIDASMLKQNAAGPRLRVTILGTASDPRIATVREAIAHWNGEFVRLGRRVQLDSGTIRANAIPDEILRAASKEVVRGAGKATDSMRANLAGVPGDIVIVLSNTDLISFGAPWSVETQGVVTVRRADIFPLSQPNTLRNVLAHELGHALGLWHNFDHATLMCGRPARCRPTAFASDTARFFPLTSSDEEFLQSRWP